MTGHGRPTKPTSQTPQIRVPNPHSAIIAIAINFTLPANLSYIGAQKNRWQKTSTNELE